MLVEEREENKHILKTSVLVIFCLLVSVRD